MRDPHADVRTSPCPRCQHPSPQDYARKNLQKPVIDGESSGYYPKELGFPRDPNNKLKCIAPAKMKATDAFKRANDETEGRVAAADD